MDADLAQWPTEIWAWNEYKEIRLQLYAALCVDCMARNCMRSDRWAFAHFIPIITQIFDLKPLWTTHSSLTFIFRVVVCVFIRDICMNDIYWRRPRTFIRLLTVCCIFCSFIRSFSCFATKQQAAWHRMFDMWISCCVYCVLYYLLSNS